MSDESSAFKNFINKRVLENMAQAIKEVHPAFPSEKLIRLHKSFPELELKARVLLVTKGLRELLPEDPLKGIQILTRVMEQGSLTGFTLWPFSEYIGQFGLPHFEASMRAMYILTQHFTSEWAVRPFFVHHEKKVLAQFSKWAKDPSSHIRRWVSEGSRPLLPWGARLPSFVKDPTPALKLLELLKDDDELYVRKSVANHLNDISKHQPQLVISTIKRWTQEATPKTEERIAWIRKQALRTLIKKGDKEALKLMGVMGKAKVKISQLKLNQKRFKVGDDLSFQFELQSASAKSQRLVIDYILDFVKANGAHGPKVFKLKTIDLPGKETISLGKKHSLKPITTKTYYSGLHRLHIQVNGEIIATLEWPFQA